MEWGDDLEFLTEKSIERGELTPSLQAMPELEPELLLLWELFKILSNSRSRSLQFGKEGMQYITPDAIVVSEILSLTYAAGVVETEQRFRLVRLIQVMDAAYLDKVTARV